LAPSIVLLMALTIINVAQKPKEKFFFILRHVCKWNVCKIRVYKFGICIFEYKKNTPMQRVHPVRRR